MQKKPCAQNDTCRGWQEGSHHQTSQVNTSRFSTGLCIEPAMTQPRATQVTRLRVTPLEQKQLQVEKRGLHQSRNMDWYGIVDSFAAAGIFKHNASLCINFSTVLVEMSRLLHARVQQLELTLSQQAVTASTPFAVQKVSMLIRFRWIHGEVTDRCKLMPMWSPIQRPATMLRRRKNEQRE